MLSGSLKLHQLGVRLFLSGIVQPLDDFQDSFQQAENVLSACDRCQLAIRTFRSFVGELCQLLLRSGEGQTPKEVTDVSVSI